MLHMLFPTFSVKPNCITLYMQSDLHRSGVMPRLTGSEVRKVNNNVLSPAQRKRIRDAINALVYISRWKRVWSEDLKKYFYFKINLITLTLPCRQEQDDAYFAKTVLPRFLEAWKKRNPELQYIWKAEVQDNGNIHFHITTNVFIHHEKLRMYWNKTLKRCKVITDKRLLTANSTDVHSVKNISNIAAYLTAYISKKDVYKKTLKRYFRRFGKIISESKAESFQLPRRYFSNLKRKPTCSLWAASKPILNAKVQVRGGDATMIREENRLSKIALKTIQEDYFTCYLLNQSLFEKTAILCPEWYKMMNARLKIDSPNAKRYYQLPQHIL